MAQQTFKAAPPNRTPHVATIGGYYTDDRKGDDGEPLQWELDLEFHPTAAFADVNAMLASIGTKDGKLVASGLDMERFLVNCSTERSAPILKALLADHDRGVDMFVLAELVMWLIGVYSERSASPGRNPTTG